MKETASEKQTGEQANQETRLLNNYQSEFLARRGFWFFFPEKKNKHNLQNLSFAKYSCIKRSCARSRAATDPGERHGAWQMRVHADQNNVHSIPLYTCMPVLRAVMSMHEVTAYTLC